MIVAPFVLAWNAAIVVAIGAVEYYIKRPMVLLMSMVIAAGVGVLIDRIAHAWFSPMIEPRSRFERPLRLVVVCSLLLAIVVVATAPLFDLRGTERWVYLIGGIFGSLVCAISAVGFLLCEWRTGSIVLAFLGLLWIAVAGTLLCILLFCRPKPPVDAVPWPLVRALAYIAGVTAVWAVVLAARGWATLIRRRER
jgi:hypothetical protein